MNSKTGDFLKELLDHGINPHAPALAAIAAANQIACVVYKLAPGGAKEAARALGWRSGREVFPLTAEACAKLAASDFVTKRWISAGVSTEVARILVLSGAGSLLLNFSPGRGYWLEPGSTEKELAASGGKGRPSA